MVGIRNPENQACAPARRVLNAGANFLAAPKTRPDIRRQFDPPMKTFLPPNPFKHAVLARQPQIGLWSSLCSNLGVEVIAGAGFDWLLLDTEHAPNELMLIFNQLQAMTGGTAAPVIRPAWNDPVLLKRYLDIGAQNFLVPMIQNADQARAAVAATRYPPAGIRGVSVANRANRYARVKDYFARANDEICVIVQIETREALANLEAIAAVPGVDALFIGPSDLAADVGHLGNSSHPEVKSLIEASLTRIHKTGKASGILTGIEADAHHWLSVGSTVVAVGSDLSLLARHTEELAARFKPAVPAAK